MKTEDLIEYIGYIFLIASAYPIGYVVGKVLLFLLLPKPLAWSVIAR